MKIKGHKVPRSVGRAVKRAIGPKSVTRTDVEHDAQAHRPRKVFLFREGDLVEIKRHSYEEDAPPPRVGIVTRVHPDQMFFDVVFGSECEQIYGGLIKVSISR